MIPSFREGAHHLLRVLLVLALFADFAAPRSSVKPAIHGATGTYLASGVATVNLASPPIGALRSRAAERPRASVATTLLGPRPSVPVRKASTRPNSASPDRTSRVTAGRPVSLTATWYCRPPTSRCTRGYSPSGMYAAISPDLAAWRGRLLRVCARTCVVVKVVDCNCEARRSIDLFSAAYRRLAPLSTGTMAVRVELLR